MIIETQCYLVLLKYWALSIAFGVGIQRAKKALEQNGNPEPVFIADQTGKFAVKIFSK